MAHEDGGLPPDGMEADPHLAIDPPGTAKPAPRDALVEALMELAGERVWEDISISDVAVRANLSLSDFRESFPSKGAVLGGFARKIDRIVLDGSTGDLADEPAKERLFDVLMRRLDALTPYKHGLDGIAEWLGRSPVAAASVNRLEVNSMRFMLEAAGIDSEGAVGAIKVQGLALLWGRVLRTWFNDDDPGLAATMAVLDRELERGGKAVARAEDVNRLISPLFALGRALFERRPAGLRSDGAEWSEEAENRVKF